MKPRNFFNQCAVALVLACFSVSVFAQDEPKKFAVYVSGASEAGVNKSFGSNLLAAITQSGKYAEIGDPEAFYKKLAKSNENSINQITQAAKQHGADFLCMVSMTEAFGAYSISARIIKISDSKVIRTALLNRSLKSLDDLAKASNELVGQLFHSQTKTTPSAAASSSTTTAAASPSTRPAAASIIAAVKKQCANKFNINELTSKIQSSFTAALKDCSVTLAKNIALSKIPFGKNTPMKEPKAFMTECTIDGIKQKLPASMNEYVKPVERFVQNILNGVSVANGQLDVKNLLKAVDEMDIDDLLNNIRKQAAYDDCVTQESSEEEDSSEEDVNSYNILYDYELTDSRDNKTYKVAVIDGQTWMVENLNYVATGSKCYNNNSANCDKYGRLYNWAAAVRACPAGWHIPSNAEWKKLMASVGNGKWKTYGFTALLGGIGYYGGGYNDVRRNGYWWSASADSDSDDAYGWDASRESENASSWGYNKLDLLSVRCVQN